MTIKTGAGALAGVGSVPVRAGAAWAKRPSGVPAVVPPPPIPLTFLAASGLGLVACGVVLAISAPVVVSTPMADRVIGAAQFGTLAVLSMALLGALHQFVPVVSNRPLPARSIAVGTFITWLIGAWAVPLGLATRHEVLVGIGGAAISVAVLLALASLALPLRARGKGTPVAGLRLALVGLLLTAGSGAAFIADRSGSWFVLGGRVVLAHAVTGLFFWVGLSYVAVAEKLWPMFLLAHVPGRGRFGAAAVGGVAIGTTVLALGMWANLDALSWSGGVVLTAGLSAHLISMGLHVHHRHRGTDLHLLFILTAALWLVATAPLALVAATVHTSPLEHERLVGAAVAASVGWALTAIIGHAHKVVPFIAWTSLRAAGVGRHRRDGRPLLFADLYDHRLAALSYGTVTIAISAIAVGLLANSWIGILIGGVSLAVCGTVTTGNLAATPLRLRLADTPPDDRQER